MTAVTYLVYNQNAKHALLLYCLVVAIYYSMKSLFFASQMTKLVYIPTVISGSFFILLLAATIMSVYYCKINKNGLTQLNNKKNVQKGSKLNKSTLQKSLKNTCAWLVSSTPNCVFIADLLFLLSSRAQLQEEEKINGECVRRSPLPCHSLPP